MRTRSLLLVPALLLLPASAWAHKHDYALSAAPSLSTGSTLWGFHVEGEKPLKKKGLGLVLDVSYHSGLHDDAHQERFTVTPGLRWTIGTNRDHAEKGISPFVHVLAGVAHVDDRALGSSGTHFAPGGGVGAYFRFAKHGAVWLQVDYLNPSGSPEGHVRSSLGLTYLFEK